MNGVEYIHSKHRNDYQREQFDDFLHKIKFSYNVPSIHVTGTNGKGSVTTFLKDITPLTDIRLVYLLLLIPSMR